jgi:hypothetical protein
MALTLVLLTILRPMDRPLIAVTTPRGRRRRRGPSRPVAKIPSPRIAAAP